jgi:hypothetical protein
VKQAIRDWLGTWWLALAIVGVVLVVGGGVSLWAYNMAASRNYWAARAQRDGAVAAEIRSQERAALDRAEAVCLVRLHRAEELAEANGYQGGERNGRSDAAEDLLVARADLLVRTQERDACLHPPPPPPPPPPAPAPAP